MSEHREYKTMPMPFDPDALWGAVSEALVGRNPQDRAAIEESAQWLVRELESLAKGDTTTMAVAEGQVLRINKLLEGRTAARLKSLMRRADKFISQMKAQK